MLASRTAKTRINSRRAVAHRARWLSGRRRRREERTHQTTRARCCFRRDRLVLVDVLDSALEVFLNDMRYINPRFTYLLT